MTEILEEEIRDKLPTKSLVKMSPNCYVADERKCLFVKTNKTLNARAMMDGEFESLKQIESTKTIRTPKRYLTIHDYDKFHNSAIVLEYLNLEKLDGDTAKILGTNLASLHDYNNKLIRYNEKSSKWIGGAAPSAKAILIHQADIVDNVDKDEDDQDKDSTSEDGDEDEGSIKYGKHQMRLKNDKTEIKPQVVKPTTSVYSDKFVPEINTEPIHEFGFDVPTSCGNNVQINNWTANWVEFFSRYRLDEPIKQIISNHGDRELNEKWSLLQLKVDKYFNDFDKDQDEKIIPALLHGDLWSGNIGQLDISSSIDDSETTTSTKLTKQPVIYDPSSFYGHSEYEFAIARMFGGIPGSFESSYFSIMPKKKNFEKRNKLYQLYHHLNHWNQFGFGYRNSSLKIMTDLNDSFK